MRKTRFSEAKIVEILNEHDATGKTARKLAWHYGVHPIALRDRKAQYGDLEVSDVIPMKQLEEANSRLEGMRAAKAVTVP